MAGIKIINVLKDDTFPELLELFRQAPAGEVIFVLPKNAKVFRKEDHFAAFASEAASGQKTIAVMAADPATGTLARKYGFSVMSSKTDGRGSASVKKIKTKLVSSPPPQDDDMIQNPSVDAFDQEDGLAIPGGEQDDLTGVKNGDEGDQERTDNGFHVEDDSGSEVTAEATLASSLDGIELQKKAVWVPVPKMKEKIQPVPLSVAPEAGLDYIETMWRDKMRSKGGPSSTTRIPIVSRIPRISRGTLFGILGVAVVCLLGAFFLVPASANLEVSPVSKPIQIQFTATASDVFSSVDQQFDKLPGQLIEISKTASASHAASGSRDVASKAHGTLTVFNEYSTTPQTLIATTRFVDPTGKIYRTLRSISVPGTSVIAGSTKPGSITVQVLADKPGADYNIPAGKFIIVSFQEKGDTERTAKIYGTSSMAMSGGANGPSSVVTQADYDAAKADATTALQKAIADALPASSEGFVVPNSDQPLIQTPAASAQPDDAADKVTVAVSGSLKTIAFRRTDLYKLIRADAIAKEHLDVVPESLDTKFTGFSYNADAGSLSFTVTASGTGYTALDSSVLAHDLTGKSSQAAHDYLQGRTDIEKATFGFSPPWARSFPASTSHISVKLRYGDILLDPSPTP